MTDSTSGRSDSSSTPDNAATRRAGGPVANPRRLRLGASGAPLPVGPAKDAQTAA